MSETKTKWAQFAITTAIGIGWSVFDRWAQLQPIFESWLPWVSPFAYIAIGASFGYMVCKALHKRQLDEKRDEIAKLEKRPTQEYVDELIEELSEKSDRITAFEKERSDLSSFHRKFHDLQPNDIELVVRVYLAEPKGLDASDSEMSRVGNGVAIRDFLSLDDASRRIQLVDGIAPMIEKCGDLVAHASRVVCEHEVSRATERAEKAEARLAEYEGMVARLAEEDRVRHMDFLAKALLYAIATGETFKVRDDDPSYTSASARSHDAFQDLMRMGLANYETCGAHERRWFGTKLAKQLVKEYPELFSEVKKEVNAAGKKHA